MNNGRLKSLELTFTEFNVFKLPTADLNPFSMDLLL